MDKAIPIDKYESILENGKIKYYAVKGKVRYEMPAYYKDMYTNDYLAIRKKTMVFPEMFETTAEHYIPLRTS